jgi:hypothetical protein
MNIIGRRPCVESQPSDVNASLNIFPPWSRWFGMQLTRVRVNRHSGS